MRSIERPPEDLTARARIRDAALAEFADKGFKGATMKAVADAAGVSVGLVQHHFGTKEALREACDQYVVTTVLDQAGQVVDEAMDADFMARAFETSGLFVRYIARAMVDGSPLAATLFDQGAALSEEFFTRNWPDRFPAGSEKVRETAAVLAAMKTGVLVLHGHVSRRLGFDVLDGRNSARLSMAVGEVYARMGEWAESAAGREVYEAVEKETS